MKKNPPVCPNCKTVFDPEVLLRARRGRGAAKAVEPKAVVEPEVEDIPVAEGDEAEDAVIEDAEELGGEDVKDVEVVEAEEA
jgi:hypothetical protein